MTMPFGISPRTFLGAFALVLLALVAGLLFVSVRSGSDAAPAAEPQPAEIQAPVIRPSVSAPVPTIAAPSVLSDRWRAQRGSPSTGDLSGRSPVQADPGDIVSPVLPADYDMAPGAAPLPSASGALAPGLSPAQPRAVVPPSPAIDPDLGACARGVGQGAEMWVVTLDSRVGVCFRQPVRARGNVRLWTGDKAVGLTARSSELGTASGGVNVLWFDRRKIAGSFSVVDWLRDPELGDRIVFASSGEDIVYDLPDSVVDPMLESLIRPVARPGYGLRVMTASLATDSLVIGVDGVRVSDGRFILELSDPFSGGCGDENGLRRAQVLAGEDGGYSATFTGFMSACIARGGRYEEDSSFALTVSLIDSGGGVVLRAPVLSSDMDVDLPAHYVSREEFGEELVRHLNAARTAAGAHPVGMSMGMVAQSHAEAMLSGCYASHWDEGGLKPYMRYALAGGVHESAEIWVGTTSFCVSDGPARIVSADDVMSLASDAVARWSASVEHTRAMTSPDMGAVSVGLAYDERNWRVVAVLETSLLEPGGPVARVEPSGRIVAAGRFTEAAAAAGYRLAVVEVRYDSSPAPIGAGTLARTSFYTHGRLLMVLSDSAGSRTERVVRYADPRDLGDQPSPASEREAADLFESALAPLDSYTAIYDYVPAVIRSEGQSFSFVVEPHVALPHLCVGIAVCGEALPGVYTVRLLAAGRDGRLTPFASGVSWIEGR